MRPTLAGVGEKVIRRWLLLPLTLTLLLLRPAVGLGQSPPPAGDQVGTQGRAKVGLVLSGGGARGLAHLGVIRWLEENRIPIDFVAGTSVGGLVGGLYATGSDSQAIVELIDDIDWQRVLRADTPYAQKSFRRKEDARDAPATFELGLRDGFKLPPGLDAGHQVGLVIDRIAFPYSDVGSFDELPTPFACVAVDLVSGRQVVFRGGDLAEAMRSTMSYPGWFAPVRSGDRIMIDGGALNNLPTDVMMQMGADVIIAVDLAMVASTVEPFDNVLGVLNRALSVMMRDNTDRNAELADALITPDVSQFGFAEFDRVDELSRIGYEAAAAVAEQMIGYALDEAAWRRYLEGRAALRRPFEATPRFLDIEGVVEADRAAVRASLDHHLDRPLDDPEHLDDDLTEITGWGRYSVVGYERRQRPGGEGLGIEILEKTYGPPFLRPIVDLRGSEFAEALITFGGRFTFLDVAGSNSEWRIDATYGRMTQLASELFVPIGHQGWFVAPRAVAGLTTQRLYDAGEAVAEYEIGDAGGGVDLGYLLGPRSQARLGFDARYQDAETKVGEELFESLQGTAGSVRAQWLFEGLDSPLVPTRGVRVDAEARWIFTSPDLVGAQFPVPADGAADADGQFYQARVDLLGAAALGGRFSFIGGAAGGTSFDATASPLQQFLVGGPLRIGALGNGELRGSNFFLGRAGLLWALAEESTLSFFGKFYLAAIYEVGDAFENDVDPYHDVTFGVVGETLLGGVFVGGAVGQDRRGGFFFAVGRLF